MDNRPVILLAYANNPDSKLSHLVKEMIDTVGILGKIDHEIKILCVYDADIEKIRVAIDEYKENIIAFMYSGHAGQFAIETAGHAMSAIGLADCLKACTALKLIFINGCSSAGQVQYLKLTAATCFIFTDSPIEDQSASDFGKTFWYRMVNGNTIDEAFEIALSNAQSFRNDKIETFKSRFLEEFEADTNNLNKWLLSLPENEEWTLQEAVNNFSKQPLYEVNKLLTNTLYKELSKSDEEIEMMSDFDSARGKIYSKFPQFFSKYIHDLCAPSPPQILIANDNDSFALPNLKRLKKMMDFYLVIKETTKALILSEVRENLIIKEIANYEFLESWLTDDIESILSGLDWLKSAGIGTVFTTELLSLNTDVLKATAGFFDETKKLIIFSEKPDANVSEKLTRKQLENLCQKGEEHLVNLIKEVLFIKDYNLVTIKNMTVYKNRAYEEIVYGFALSYYKWTDFQKLDPLETKERKIKLIAPDNFSILLTRKNEPDIIKSLSETSYLNLSPFLIDNNTLFDKAQIPNISFWESIEKDALVYKTFYLPDEAKLLIKENLEDSNKKSFYANLRLQFDHFFSLLPKTKTNATN